MTERNEMEALERIARAIANAMGDNFADAFKNKTRWIAKRGKSGGRFRDVNEPMQADYLAAAEAVRALCMKCGGSHRTGSCDGPLLPSKPRPHAGRMMG